MTPVRLILIVLSVFLLQPVLLYANGPDEQTRALIEKLRLKESAEPVRNSPLWEKPDKVYIALPPVAPEKREEFLASAREVVSASRFRKRL